MVDRIFGKDTRYGDIWQMQRGDWWDDKGNHTFPPTPEGLVFTVHDQLERKGVYLTLRGWLENTTNESLEVSIFPAPEIFNLHIVNAEQIPLKPLTGPNPPYQVPPPPHVLFMEGEERIQFTAVLNLNAYDYASGVEALVEWTFSYWHEPRPRGRLQIRLDP